MRILPEWPWPSVMAHRCGGALAPENTLAGLRVCKAVGCQGVEFDVMLTRDGTAILIHDETLDRTTTGSGPLIEFSDTSLWALDAGGYHHDSFEGEPIPRFTQALERCRALDLAANVEIKPATGHERATGIAVAQLAMQGRDPGALPPLLSSFSATALLAAAQTAPQLPRGWLVDTIPEDWKTHCHALDVVSIHTNCAHLTQAQAEAVRATGMRLVVYTENDPEHARLLRGWGVDSFITDRPDLIRV
ncbi:MAG: glycerophosphodiester phosphodiesterase [Rhodocyclales bacterium]|nr:glycerophosphodiester phosphodiesterase [Rhodocyclales bacterium]